MAIIVGVALVGASGAATTKAQKVTKINVSTRAAVVHYLRSIHVNAKHAVIQRGGRNYAGAHCPGKGWTCASTKHTVVQIAKRGGVNRFACKSDKCVVVQLSGVSHGVYSSIRQLAGKGGGGGGSTASCSKTGSSTTNAGGQSCLINQAGSGPNTAAVYENSQKSAGSTLSTVALTAVYSAQITQSATGGSDVGNNTACVTQNIALDGSTTVNKGNVSVTLEAHQSVLINQDSSNGTNTAVNGAAPGPGSTAACNTQTLAQNQTLTSTVTGKAQITQNENDQFILCGDGVTGEYANLCLNIQQNMLGANGSTNSGANNAKFNQNSTQTAIANTPNGPVTQTQSTPLCSTDTAPTSAPADCVFPGGIVGTIDQDSHTSSSATATQVETQCEDASDTTALTTCRNDGHDQDFGGSYTLTQNQYGPEGIGKLPARPSKSRVPSRTGKGLGQSTQTGGNGNLFTLIQTSTQDNDQAPGGTQLNSSQADCSSANGSCTAGQTTTVNGTGTSDGYTSPSIGQLLINCPKNQPCVPTPPPAPQLTSEPPTTNASSSGTFAWTDDATGGITFKCSFDRGAFKTTNCSSGTSFFQGYGAHSFQVEAVDNTPSHNASAPTAEYDWTNVPPDPTILTHPSNPATYGSSTFTFKDADSTVGFKCQIDSGPITRCDSGTITYSGSSVVSSGEHTFSVWAYDSGSNTTSVDAATSTWWITPPDPTITSTPPSNPDFSGNSYTFTFTDQDTTVQYQCQIDNQPAVACDSGTSPTYSGLDPGSHTFTVTAYGANDSGLTHPNTTPTTVTWTILPLAVSALGGADNSSAGWACQPGGPIALTVGPTPYPPGTFAQVAITNAGGIAIDDLSGPTFTTDNYAAGSPRFVIDLSNGDQLLGYPGISGLNGTDMAWSDSAMPGGNDTYRPWGDVQSFEAGASTTLVDAYVIADGDQSAGTTDKISDLTFNETDFNPGTCPAAPPAP